MVVVEGTKVREVCRPCIDGMGNGKDRFDDSEWFAVGIAEL